ncbi:MAG: ATP-binding protein [Propionibacteriaceae bacterium]
MLQAGNAVAGYLPRYLDAEIEELLAGLSAVALDGPKAVGKTETATRHSDAVLNFDSADVCQAYELDPDGLLTREARVCVDEWQRQPQVWDRVRRLVDAKTDTRFLLTGSASPHDGVDTHSGAARITSMRMRPLSLAERSVTAPTIALKDLFEGTAAVSGRCDFTALDYAREICASGFPAVNELAPKLRRRALESYATRIIDRDLVEMGMRVRRPASLRAWMTAYAAASSTDATYSTILNSATAGEADKPSKASVQVYRNLLDKIWVLDPVPAWTPSLKPLGRLTVGEKHQLCDPGLAAHLLGATEEKLTSGANGSAEIFGQLFESLATLSVRAAAIPAEAKVSHLRTASGRQEVDLIVERFDGAVIGIEVKLAKTITDRHVAHLHWLGDKIGDRMVDKIVLYAGDTAGRRPDGVGLIPLAMFY